jgi:hypothetical protein
MFNKSITMKANLETQAQAWATGGETDALLWDHWEFLIALYWVHSEGGKTEGLSQVAKRFLNRCHRYVGDQQIRQLSSGRDYCGGNCGWEWTYDSLSFCTHCRKGYCFGCKERFPKLPNGNLGCRWCDLGELVG